MQNPFEKIDARLSNIESLLLTLKHQGGNSQPAPAIVPDRNEFTLPEFCQYAKISKSKAYKLTSKGNLRHYKRGKNIFIKKEDADKYLEGVSVCVDSVADHVEATNDYLKEKGAKDDQ